jgi:hypothetical protein
MWEQKIQETRLLVHYWPIEVDDPGPPMCSVVLDQLKKTQDVPVAAVPMLVVPMYSVRTLYHVPMYNVPMYNVPMFLASILRVPVFSLLMVPQLPLRI